MTQKFATNTLTLYFLKYSPMKALKILSSANLTCPTRLCSMHALEYARSRLCALVSIFLQKCFNTLPLETSRPPSRVVIVAIRALRPLRARVVMIEIEIQWALKDRLTVIKRRKRTAGYIEHALASFICLSEYFREGEESRCW